MSNRSYHDLKQQHSFLQVSGSQCWKCLYSNLHHWYHWILFWNNIKNVEVIGKFRTQRTGRETWITNTSKNCYESALRYKEINFTSGSGKRNIDHKNFSLHYPIKGLLFFTQRIDTKILPTQQKKYLKKNNHSRRTCQWFKKGEERKLHGNRTSMSIDDVKNEKA